MTDTVYDTFIIAAGSLVFGLVLLIKASDRLVASSSFVARRFGWSEFFIGATVVAFGTSAPELFISVSANLAGNPGVAIGNVVGSNTVNVMVILGIAAVLFPLAFRQTMLLRDVLVLVGSSVLFAALVLWGGFGFWWGVAMLVALAGFVGWQFIEDRPDGEDRPRREVDTKESLARHLSVIALCLVLLVAGTEFLVKGAVAAGDALGISETLVAMTVVAVGTSFPELTTSILAAMRGKGDMVIGNILGSNIFNILAIMGVTAILAPIDTTSTVDPFDLAMFVGSAFALFAAVWLKGIPRLAGCGMLFAYAGYVCCQYYVI